MLKFMNAEKVGDLLAFFTCGQRWDEWPLALLRLPLPDAARVVVRAFLDDLPRKVRFASGVSDRILKMLPNVCQILAEGWQKGGRKDVCIASRKNIICKLSSTREKTLFW